jgi:hypothetical protein
MNISKQGDTIMNSYIKNLTVFLLVVITSVSFAASNRLDVALKTSVWGDQTDAQNRVTSIKNPLSVGFQMRYHFRPDFALQLANESLKGSTYNSLGEGLNVHTSLSALVYPVKYGRVLPYVNFGFNWSQRHDPNTKSLHNTQNDLNVLTGIGFDLPLLGNMIYSLETRAYSDGLNYLGWGTTFSMGYRF